MPVATLLAGAPLATEWAALRLGPLYLSSAVATDVPLEGITLCFTLRLALTPLPLLLLAVEALSLRLGAPLILTLPLKLASPLLALHSCRARSSRSLNARSWRSCSSASRSSSSR